MLTLTRTRTTAPAPTAALDEARANIAAVAAMVTALGSATTVDEALDAALATVREHFDWAYGSYWEVDSDRRALVFARESGAVGADFRRATAEASFAEGVGLAGRAWRAKDLVFVDDLGAVTDCVRAPAAQAAGVKSGVCFPVVVGGRVHGTMDFFTTHSVQPSADRLDALRAIGLMVSDSVDRLSQLATHLRAAQDLEAVTTLLRKVSVARSRSEALSTALDTIRAGFGWDYGSFWQVDDQIGALRFVQDSGSVNEEFSQVTASASFPEGVGVAGRAWQSRDLVFVPDLAEVTDCVRAPAARRAGVKSGLCLPILVAGRVVGTLDFFLTRAMVLSQGRRDALINVGALLGQTLERLDAADRLATAGNELVASIGEVERNVVSASSVAAQGSVLAREANEDVARLGTASAEIGEIVRVIQSIADQTNLLALNATIEAARAGDAGRGFAVVAGEVKALANETASATTSVAEKVSTIQSQVERVVGSLGDIDVVVQKINETQSVIGGVLTQQVAVTREILG